MLMPTLLAGGAGYTMANGVPDVVKSAIGLPPSSSGDPNYSLMQQIAELRNAIAAKPTNVTVVSGGDNKSSLSMTTLACVGIAATGGIIVVRYYFKMGLSDLVWVTKKTFEDGMAHVESGLDHFGETLSKFRKSVQERFSLLTERQDVIVKNQELIGEQLGETHSEVGELRAECSVMSHAVQGVSTDIKTVDGKVDLLSQKHEDSTVEVKREIQDNGREIQHNGHGIKLLCSVVSESLALHPHLADKATELKLYSTGEGEIESQPAPQAISPPLSRSNSSRSVSLAGLTGIPPAKSPSMDSIENMEGWRERSVSVSSCRDAVRTI